MFTNGIYRIIPSLQRVPSQAREETINPMSEVIITFLVKQLNQINYSSTDVFVLNKMCVNTKKL